VMVRGTVAGEHDVGRAHPVAAINAHLDAASISSLCDDGDHAAFDKIDVPDRLVRYDKFVIPTKVHSLHAMRYQSEVVRCEASQQAIANGSLVNHGPTISDIVQSLADSGFRLHIAKAKQVVKRVEACQRIGTVPHALYTAVQQRHMVEQSAAREVRSRCRLCQRFDSKRLLCRLPIHDRLPLAFTAVQCAILHLNNTPGITEFVGEAPGGAAWRVASAEQLPTLQSNWPIVARGPDIFWL
jgi:hypothetical protein